ncbi:uncharacterized protein CMU_031600 [Cryptosporidium muris RN66]|uniref:Altered inheritance of mitochondria protein 24, mitochondrial n=1 Tax=Cryptosporidium muris (strain RN66) TaxID=441375 RepID=B6AIH8_CRYMR|nr:uncharacterized protein CMU_031600 [Cryptosporidium muris RN66]EEA08019.1 hypothetical protein, conserved [Cryptosporidium muris RN66]|eukprot:XP_002142368.1 hypothetical protein [Cryptosporidium muris RN66]
MSDKSSGNSIIDDSLGNAAILPRAVIDGSKLILRLKKDEKLSYEAPTKILFSNMALKVEHSVWWLTDVVLSEPNNLIVLDSAAPEMRFFPVPMRKFGILYTREGVGHVITGDITRARISSRSIPYKNCNKFEYTPRQSANTSDDIDVIYLRGDDSFIRYTLQPNEHLELSAGAVIAWTAGVTFTFKSFCCLKFVTAVVGDPTSVSTVWIAFHRPRSFHQHG